jgi:uncharacterized membrane protein YuzA (DUF378 family)
MRVLHKVAFILLVIGGLNWLLHAFNWNVIDYLGSAVATVVYVLVGLAAIYEIFTHSSKCKDCGKAGKGAAPSAGAGAGM